MKQTAITSTTTTTIDDTATAFQLLSPVDQLNENVLSIVGQQHVAADEGEGEITCPDCDCIMEIFYGERSGGKCFCDNCGVLVKDSNTLNVVADMDISMENCYSGW